jgi:CRISPR-associated protein Cas1
MTPESDAPEPVPQTAPLEPEVVARLEPDASTLEPTITPHTQPFRMIESKNLQELPKFRDGLSYLYLEQARIERDQNGIAFLNEDGFTRVPAAGLATLLLGPGTSVTFAAIQALARNGCSLQWVGQDGTRFYAAGLGETRSSRNLMRQALAWADQDTHLEVVKRMYQMRFPQKLDPNLSLKQIRGLEGVRVRTAYQQASETTNVPWHGRNYQRGTWGAADPVNRALSAGAACLYGVCHAGIVSSGYSPALGFVHTGKQLSFVFDIADLYKAELLIPTAFEVAAESPERIEPRTRTRLRDTIRTNKLLERVVTDLHALFDGLDLDDYDQDFSAPGGLWDPEGEVEGGINHADLENTPEEENNPE